MGYNNISDEELNNMIQDILNGKNEEHYVDERASQFIKSLQGMVQDRDTALKNYRNLM